MVVLILNLLNLLLLGFLGFGVIGVWNRFHWLSSGFNGVPMVIGF